MTSELFEKLSEDKKLMIINAAISCFARSGYKKTAISEIATEADISKASIFQYFGTKKNLYLHIYNYISNKMLARMTDGTEDLFECLSLYNQICMELNKEHPGIFELLELNLIKADFDNDDEIQEIIKLEQDRCEQSVDVIFEKVDWQRLQDGYDRDTVLNLAVWIKDGCLTQLSADVSEENFYAELERYLAIIKKAVYKPEYL